MKNCVGEWAAISAREDAKRGWNAARLGMIPAENAVTFDWDRHPLCAGARIIYEYGETGEVCWAGNGSIRLGYWTKSPTPAWSPKVGDAMFYRTGENFKNVGTFKGEHENFDMCWKLMDVNGNMILPAKCDCKPFHPDHIGKKWEEIPGGKE